MRTILVTLLVGSAARIAFAADDLGERVLFDALQVAPADWRTEKNLTVTKDGGSLVLRTVNIDYGWATTDDYLPVLDTATADIEVKSATNGQLNVQVEWLREDGTLISAPNILAQAKSGASVTGKELAELLPKGENPKKFRLKFWVEGKDAEVQITRAVVRFPRAFRKKDTRLVQAYDARLPFKTDPGIHVQVPGNVLVAKLEPKTAYSAFFWEQKIAYDPNAVLLLDLASLKSGVVSVQALCFNEAGEVAKTVDLIKDASSSGVYEVPLKKFADQFPAGASKLSFKFWLAGNDTSASIAGLFYGVTQ